MGLNKQTIFLGSINIIAAIIITGWKHFTAGVILTRSEISGISAAMKIIQIHSVRNYKYQLRAASSSDTLVSAAAAFICAGVERRAKIHAKKERCGDNCPGSAHRGGHDLLVTPSGWQMYTRWEEGGGAD